MERLFTKLRSFRAGKDLAEEESSLKAEVVKVFLPDFRRNITAIKIPYEGSTFTQQEWIEWISVNMKGLEGEASQHASILMQKFMQGAKYIETLTRNERGKPDFQLPTMLITIKNDDALSIFGYNEYVESIMIKASHLKEFAEKSQDEVIRWDYNEIPMFTGTAQQQFLMAGIEETDHATYHRCIGSELTTFPNEILSIEEHDSEPIELRALYEQKKYADANPADFHPEMLEILERRIQAALVYQNE